MYRIFKLDGTDLGLTDSVQYIRYGNSGCFLRPKEWACSNSCVRLPTVAHAEGSLQTGGMGETAT